MKSLNFSLAALISMALVTGANSAEWQPQKPIRVVVPYAAGGGADIIMRRLADKAKSLLGQPMIVDNRPGAATAIGASAVANSKADGYTLLFATSTTLGINPLFRKQLTYSVDQFKPVAGIENVPFMLDVSNTLPVDSLGALVTYARAHPGKVNYGTLGIGSSSHLLGEILTKRVGEDLVPIHFTSSPPAWLSLIRGDIHVYFDGIPASLPRTKSGEFRGVAVTSKERAPAAPSVPTVYELGFPELGATVWYGLVAPSGTPDDVIKRINEVINTALNDPTIAESIMKDGAFPLALSPDAFGKWIAEDTERWRILFDAVKIKLDKE